MSDYLRVVWLDNEIDNFKIDIGHLALSRIICYPTRTLTDMHSVLNSISNIDVMVVDKELNGEEDGERMLSNFRIAFPEIGALVYSGYVDTELASKNNSIGYLKKSASLKNRIESHELANSIRNSFEFRPSEVELTQTYSRWQHTLSVTWEMIHSFLTPTGKTLGYLAIIVISILQVAPIAGTDSPDIFKQLVDNLIIMLPLVLTLICCWALYWWKCPPRLRGCSSLHDYEKKWHSQYVSNPNIALSVNEDLGSVAYQSNNAAKNAIINIDLLFYQETKLHPFSRHLVAVGLISAMVLYIYAILSGILDARKLFL